VFLLAKGPGEVTLNGYFKLKIDVMDDGMQLMIKAQAAKQPYD
jgi:hypothetical protein